jgi:hypothetical protein
MRPPSSLIAKFALAIVAGALAFAQSAHAAPPPPMIVAVHPAGGAISSYFQLGARPGHRASAGTLELRNRSSRRVTVLLDPVDSLTASTLGSAYQVRGMRIHGPARWIRLSTRRLVLTPHGTANVRVSVLAPAGAVAGDYLSGVSVQALTRPQQIRLRGNVGISSIQRYAVGLFVRLAGPRHPLIRLTRASIDREPAGVTFFVFGRNAGNVILQNVRGNIEITQGKRAVAHATIGPGTFVTNTSIAYPVLALRERPREGAVYSVHAWMRYAGGIARLDTTVRFGHASALRQETFGGPKASHRGGGMLVLILIGVAVAAAGAGGTLFWRHRRLSGLPAALRTLERALDAATAGGEPLSLIRVADHRSGGSTQQLTAIVRAGLRRSDRLCRLDGSELLIVAPDTAPETAGVLAGELRRQLERVEADSESVAIEVLAPNGETAADLLARVTRSNGGSHPAEPSG